MTQEVITLKSSFDYDALPSEINRDELKAATGRIRSALRRSGESMVSAGEELSAVKATLPHGRWLPYLRNELGISASSAEALMRVAELATEMGERFTAVANLPATTLYALASPTTTRDIIEGVIEGEIAPTEEAIRAARSSEPNEHSHATKASAGEAERLRDEVDTAQRELAAARRQATALRQPAGILTALGALPMSDAVTVLEQASRQLLDRATAPVEAQPQASVQLQALRDGALGLLRSPEWRKQQRIRRQMAALAESLPRSFNVLQVEHVDEIAVALRELPAAERSNIGSNFARSAELLGRVAQGIATPEP